MSDEVLRATVRRLEQAAGSLATQSVARMDEQLPWFRAMPADHRSWVTLIAQAGVASLVHYMRHPGTEPQLTGEVFGRAPRSLMRAVTLRQTVELVRVTVEVLEERVDQLAAPGEAQALREAVLRFTRDVAFAAARLYAALAENRGSWDARLEAIVVDSLLRGDDIDALPGRTAALGWSEIRPVTVVAGLAKERRLEAIHHELQRHARTERVELLAGVHGDQLIVVLGGTKTPKDVVSRLLPCFGPGPVVLGPTITDLGEAARSARAAVSGLLAAPAWPAAPRPVWADDLLPERALAGDPDARRALVVDVHDGLRAGGDALFETVSEYLASGATLEGTARALFVHPNTVRYRLRRATDLCGVAATDPRGAFTLHVALALGRLKRDTAP